MGTPVPLETAVLAGDLAAVEHALKNGQDPNARDGSGRTPLMHAAIQRNKAVAQRLVEAGADLSLADAAGWSALHFAAQEQDPALVEMLVLSGAAIDAQDAHGNSPLSRAVFSSRGRADTIRLLLRYGADPNLTNASGVSPMMLAKRIANYDLAPLFAE